MTKVPLSAFDRPGTFFASATYGARKDKMLVPEGYISAAEVMDRARDTVAGLSWPLRAENRPYANSIERSVHESRRRSMLMYALANALFHEFLDQHRSELRVWSFGQEVLRARPSILRFADDGGVGDLRAMTRSEAELTLAGSIFARSERYLFLDEINWTVKIPTLQQRSGDDALSSSEQMDLNAARRVCGYQLLLPIYVDWSSRRFEELLPVTDIAPNSGVARANSAQITSAIRALSGYLDRLRQQHSDLPRKRELFEWHAELHGLTLNKAAKATIWDRLKVDFPELARPGRPRRARETRARQNLPSNCDQ